MSPLPYVAYHQGVVMLIMCQRARVCSLPACSDPTLCHQLCGICTTPAVRTTLNYSILSAMVDLSLIYILLAKRNSSTCIHTHKTCFQLVKVLFVYMYMPWYEHHSKKSIVVLLYQIWTHALVTDQTDSIQLRRANMN